MTRIISTLTKTYNLTQAPFYRLVLVPCDLFVRMIEKRGIFPLDTLLPSGKRPLFLKILQPGHSVPASGVNALIKKIRLLMEGILLTQLITRKYMDW